MLTVEETCVNGLCSLLPDDNVSWFISEKKNMTHAVMDAGKQITEKP